MRMAIQKNNGQWWTGVRWGVEQAREVYESIEDLPLMIEGAEPEIQSRKEQGCLKIIYLAAEEADDAGVVEIG